MVQKVQKHVWEWQSECCLCDGPYCEKQLIWSPSRRVCDFRSLCSELADFQHVPASPSAKMTAERRVIYKWYHCISKPVTALLKKKDKHILGTCCGLLCLFLHTAQFGCRPGWNESYVSAISLLFISRPLALVCYCKSHGLHMKKVSLFISQNFYCTPCTSPKSRVK